ncbi:MAG: electron transport complex subunit RsxC [Gammaproteobacteria bacterium]|nr:electron transport complex subunit RsxC [Gammaproteobacteria bacterium]
MGALKRRLWSFHGGVHPVQHKHVSTHLPIQQPRLPRRIVLPLHQHIGESAESLVRVGERVLKGQMIAHASGYVSAPVHASTSGTVVEIGEAPIPHPSGLSAPCIVIEPDGEERWIEHGPVENYRDLPPSALRNLIREAGIVGLGGAGFPSYIKLNPGHHKTIKTLILNGVECEPFITCDDMLMRERADAIRGGIEIIRHALQAEECLIAIEDNKPAAYEAMRRAVAGMDKVEAVQVPTLYPQGSEKQLVRVLTGKEVPRDGLCLNVGVVCVNVGTAAAVHRAIHLGEPLISRIVTVTGGAVGRPCNMEVLIGTPMNELIGQCDGNINRIDRLIMGGPMMGFALHRTDLPVIKTTNCVLAATAHDLPPVKPVMPCIRCGACADACPVNLLPQQLYWHAKTKNLDKAQEYDLFDCIECGACSYVCPSNIPLVQYFRYAKGDIWTREREKEKAELARRRHDSRQKRLEREKAEREAKRQQKKSALDAAAMAEKGQEAAAAAQQQAESRRDAALREAEKRRGEGWQGHKDDTDRPRESNRESN